MNLKKTAIVFMLTLIVGVGVFSIVYTTIRLRDHQEFLEEGSQDIERIEKAQGETITLTETKDGSRKWVLKMKEIEYSKDKSVAQLNQVQGLVYGNDEKALFSFEAPKGQYFKDKNRVILTDGARMHFPSGKVTMSAGQMEWSSESNMIQARGGVKMSKKDFGTSTAQNAAFAADFSSIHFSGGVTSIIGGK